MKHSTQICVVVSLLMVLTCRVVTGQMSVAQPWPVTRGAATDNDHRPGDLYEWDPYDSRGTNVAQGPFPRPLIPNLAPPVASQFESSVLQWRLLPQDNIYPFYLADPKASRVSGVFVRPPNDNLLLDATLGGRFGVFRLGDSLRSARRRGVQLDVEASAQIRLDMEEEVDVRSTDYRAGLPLSFAMDRWHFRVGYYHLSSHLGDEFLIKNNMFNRLNFSRDVLFTGAGFWITDRLRIYGEIGWAFYSDVSKQWELNGGIEYLPTAPTGWMGSPFWAVHAHAREELNYGGSLNAQLGWAWRASATDRMLRFGIRYYEGKSTQWSFFDKYEPLVGMGLWFDY